MPSGRKTVINLMYTANLVGERTTELLKPFGITVQQFNVLRILRGQKGKPANLFTIQERMIHKMSNTTRLVDKLIEKKLVDRMVCPNNRRKVEISITDSGLKLLSEIDGPIDELNLTLVEAFTPEELETFNIFLERIRS
ncbi:MarR family winged helix-turn-helix transcriptional regulator [Robertkochia solimangrovi]|uniref:MarR family winged helix-turn-helix transcriptional regulator n=1 Tax=Robertkochia solimangrovi TaxID=2213046 RepID=UPI001F54C631|nr:MarR family transcriptional regulator [Robertkochia solimangrovi]